MGIPPSDAWLAYCVDEALHVLAAGHTARDRGWEDRFRRDPDDGRDLYGEIMADPRAGKPPSRSDLAALAAAKNGN